jgi:hypothetical protein
MARNTTGIGLEATGVELDARGYIRVTERLETTASSKFARSPVKSRSPVPRLLPGLETTSDA